MLKLGGEQISFPGQAPFRQGAFFTARAPSCGLCLNAQCETQAQGQRGAGA